MGRAETAKRLGNGVYEYQGWWVAVKKGSSKVSYFANSKKELMQMIDKYELAGGERRNDR